MAATPQRKRAWPGWEADLIASKSDSIGWPGIDLSIMMTYLPEPSAGCVPLSAVRRSCAMYAAITTLTLDPRTPAGG